MIRTIAATLILGAAVCACGPQRPTIDPALESGVTSSNGGGVRTTGGLNQVEIGPNGSRPINAAGPGRAY